MPHESETQEIREVLLRAEEIQRQERLDLIETTRLQEIVNAAEEIGLSREVVIRAIRERQSTVGMPVEAGMLVLAPVERDRLYVAEVKNVREDIVDLRFLNGSEHTTRASDLRPFQLLPGQKVRCEWPHWGWWTCTVVSCDREQRIVRASDGWGTTQSFPLQEVYVPVPKPESEERKSLRTRLLAAGIALLATGGTLGWLITFLAMR